MKRAWIWLGIAGVAAGCGKGKDEHARWFESPERVVQGIMHAYETRDDSLYAAFLAEDFIYTFEPEGADSGDVLTWGKSEEVLSASSLFSTPDVESVRLILEAGTPRPAPARGGPERMTVPMAGGELIISVQGKDATRVKLNRQELVVEKVADGKRKWRVVEWHDYPAPFAMADSEAPGEAPSGSSGGAPPDSAAAGHDHHSH